MTLDELIERLEWQREGRLQYRKGMACDGPEWFDLPANSHSTLVLGDRADFYRRRPDPPPMPDEVWVSDNQKPECDGAGDTFTAHAFMCGAKAWHGGKLIRYVRAGAVIPATQTEWRYITESSSDQNWKPNSRTDVEYRIKP